MNDAQEREVNEMAAVAIEKLSLFGRFSLENRRTLYSYGSQILPVLPYGMPFQACGPISLWISGPSSSPLPLMFSTSSKFWQNWVAFYFRSTYSIRILTSVVDNFADMIDQSKLADSQFFPPPISPSLYGETSDETLTTIYQVVQQINDASSYERMKADGAARLILDKYKGSLPLADSVKEDIRAAFPELKKRATESNWYARSLMVLLSNFMLEHGMLLLPLCVAASKY
jgi:hypothetical protein